MQVPFIERVRAAAAKAEITRDQAREALATIDLDDVEQIVRLSEQRTNADALANSLNAVMRDHERRDLRPSTKRAEPLASMDLPADGPYDISFEDRFLAELNCTSADQAQMPKSWPDDAGDEEQQRGNALGAIGKRLKERSLQNVVTEKRKLWEAHVESAPFDALLAGDIEPSGPVDPAVAALTQSAINNATRREAAAASALLVTLA